MVRCTENSQQTAQKGPQLSHNPCCLGALETPQWLCSVDSPNVSVVLRSIEDPAQWCTVMTYERGPWPWGSTAATEQQ